MTYSSAEQFSPKPRYSQKPSGKIEGLLSPSPLNSPFRKPTKDKDGSIPKKAVICFQCGLISSVPKSALSTRCHHCAAYISLDNVVLQQQTYKTQIQTRGNVIVKPGANLKGITIHCHHLYMNGPASGNFYCSGLCHIKSDQVITGTLRAHTLIIEKRTSVSFTKPIETRKARIMGELHSHINASGTVTILKGGKILGDIIAASLVIEEGGVHSGYYKKR